ncbi:hypothetical protein [Legionella worsleiensis]|uniref:Uncharacterized protein n=1 Tax=Legionella worsleiensis TaxID=45076 RepID=A0A0W1AFU6_9GAMM|nr:hypothetical protein [Legionella worsleiensis]KTD80204.1 hypothetical protein Lwor_1112 [Legionella worsleiensis]STY31741.1 Uncharacterised protein [Legionella worsleiensis]
MQYAVTFCTFDGEAGANPLWHSCLLLSQMDEKTQQLEVVDTWGFYGLPSTSQDNPIISKIKIKLGLNIDFFGNHGMLRHEEIRYLDLGRGLHGTTFELTAEQFNYLQQKCLEMAAQQNRAITEYVESFGIARKSPEETRIYPYEHCSREIFNWEKKRAAQHQYEPRLKPFEVRFSWGWSGLALTESDTCKTQSLLLLKHVLSDEQISRLTEGGKHPTVPRYSGTMEDIILHSTGPLKQHVKRSGETVYYRDSEVPGVRLYWTVPPQDVDALSSETLKLLNIDREYCAKVKSTVRKLQRLEWLLRNAKIPEPYHQHQDALVKRLVACYKAFSKIEPQDTTPAISGVQGFFYSLVALPRSRAELRLQKKISAAELLFNSLYMAIVDRININLDLPIEPVIGSDLGEERAGASSSAECDSVADENPLEAVVNYLSVHEQMDLCQIIGRHYCVDDELEAASSQDHHDDFNVCATQ